MNTPDIFLHPGLYNPGPIHRQPQVAGPKAYNDCNNFIATFSQIPQAPARPGLFF